MALPSYLNNACSQMTWSTVLHEGNKWPYAWNKWLGVLTSTKWLEWTISYNDLDNWSNNWPQLLSSKNGMNHSFYPITAEYNETCDYFTGFKLYRKKKRSKCAVRVIRQDKTKTKNCLQRPTLEIADQKWPDEFYFEWLRAYIWRKWPDELMYLNEWDN